MDEGIPCYTQAITCVEGDP